MSEVGNWLAEMYGINTAFWVHVQDEDDSDDFRWGNDGQTPSLSFWAMGQPNHFDGNCAYLFDNHLKVFSCFEATGYMGGLYPLCRLYPWNDKMNQWKTPETTVSLYTKWHTAMGTFWSVLTKTFFKPCRSNVVLKKNWKNVREPFLDSTGEHLNHVFSLEHKWKKGRVRKQQEQGKGKLFKLRWSLRVFQGFQDSHDLSECHPL